MSATILGRQPILSGFFWISACPTTTAQGPLIYSQKVRFKRWSRPAHVLVRFQARLACLELCGRYCLGAELFGSPLISDACFNADTP
ncbi:hypothetical protein B0H14DRAFT_1678812 [Mycena olivaceomarginata]|nr:hypothetical protein B0H14DRAFT_1678812 [Mycena olivaceomarginata]